MHTQTYPKHIYDPSFRYVKADKTDIRQTFERIKAEQQRIIDVEVQELIESWMTVKEIA